MDISYYDCTQILLTAVESNDLDKYLSFFTDKSEYKIGNSEPLVGIQGIRDIFSIVTQKIQKVSHNIKNIWVVEDNVVLCHTDVIYQRKDGNVFQIPSMVIMRFQGGKIQKYHAFIDTSPVFSST